MGICMLNQEARIYKAMLNSSDRQQRKSSHRTLRASFTGINSTRITAVVQLAEVMGLKVLLMSFWFFGVTCHSVHSWMTEFDLPFVFGCPTFHSLTYLKSVHNNKYEDRVWDFGCSSVLPTGNPLSYTCQWSDYLNDFDEPISYQCPGNGYINGIFSFHDNGKEDRRFKVYCCATIDLIPYSCVTTPWLNNLDQDFHYNVPSGMVLRGMESFHSNHYEDRRFKVNVCNIRKTMKSSMVM